MIPKIYDNVHFFKKDGTVGKGTVIKKNVHHFLNVLINSPESFTIDINKNMISSTDFSDNSLITFTHSGKTYYGIINYSRIINSCVIELDEPNVSYTEPISIKYTTEIEYYRIIKIIDSLPSDI
jgi:uncharacterized protein YaaR (DUF327 family)